MTEQLHPYATPGSAPVPAPRVRIPHLQQMKERGEKWAMLTAYDMYTAAIFEDAGIPVLLIGDSASNNVFGNDSLLPVTVDELMPLVRAVSRCTRRPLVIADLPFGSYQASPEQCFHTAVRFMKEGGAHAVKLEGGIEMVPQVRKLVSCGIPVMAHIGFTPQSEHQLGGFRVQGRGDDGARRGCRPDHRGAEDPHRRHRGGQRLRCTGAGLAGHGRAAHRQAAALREAVRGHARAAAEGGT